MRANYIYIIILVIILIGFLCTNIDISGNCDIIPEEDRLSVTSDEVVLKLESQFIKSNIIDAIAHLHMLKNNLSTLNKMDYKSHEFNIRDIDALIKSSTIDLNDFKHANNFDDSESDLKIDTHMMHTLYDSHYSNRVSRSDLYSDAQYEKYNMLNLIIDIQIVMLLLENGKNNGRIKLDNLHELIKLYSRITDGADYISYDAIFGGLDGGIKDMFDDENNYKNQYTYDYGIKHKYKHATQVMKHHNSHDIDYGIESNIAGVSFHTRKMGLQFDPNDQYIKSGEFRVTDSYAPIFDKAVMKINPARNEYNTSYNTQYMYDSGYTALVKRNGIQNYIPLCDINKIRTDRERIRAPLIDSKSRQSLRNDY